METLSYVLGTETEITTGAKLYFGQLWDGEGDGAELLESGTVSPDGETIVAFQVIQEADDLMETLVEVTDLY